MIDATVSIAPARDLVALDLWEGSLADLGPVLAGTETLQVEPHRWWLHADEDRARAIRAALGGRGALAPFGGGVVVATVAGDWRGLLSISGFLDVERLPSGTVASTIIHHVPVRIVGGEEKRCQVYFAASYARTLSELWDAATSTAPPPR